MASIKESFKKWIKAPKPVIREIPRKGEAVVQIFRVKKKTNSGLLVGVTMDHLGKLEGTARDYTSEYFPYAMVLKSNIEEYKEGDIVYLKDEVLNTTNNEEYALWLEETKHKRPQMKTLPPPQYKGGLSSYAEYEFKKDKLSQEEEDDVLYQLPYTRIRGHVDVSEFLKK